MRFLSKWKARRLGLSPGEAPLLVFVSSVMTSGLQRAREEAVSAIRSAPGLLVPWAFEFTPASSEPRDESYLRKVREADFVVWLVREETSRPVQTEIRQALASSRRLIVIKLPATSRDAA